MYRGKTTPPASAYAANTQTRDTIERSTPPTPITATQHEPKLLLPTTQAYYPNYSPISPA